MASIEEKTLKDGTLSFVITVSLGRDPSGKKLFKKTTFRPTCKAPTKARREAESFAVNYETKVLSGNIVEDENISFSDFVAIWEKNWLTAKTPSVQDEYKRKLNKFVIPEIGYMKLTAIRATHIDKILKGIQGENKAASTVRDIKTVINSVFKYAYKKQYVMDNPCGRCDDLPPVKMATGKDLHFFNQDQARRFLRDALTMEYEMKYGKRGRKSKKTGKEYTVKEYTVNHSVHLQWRIYFMIAIMGQLRRGEMCALTWNDIHFDSETVSIDKAVAKADSGVYMKGPKTEAGIRELNLPAEIFSLLRIWKNEQRLLCLQLGTAWMGHRDGKNDDGTADSFDNNRIFIRLENGLPVDLATPNHKFHEIIDLYNATCEKEENKLPHIRLHDLRHTGATLLLGENMDIETVSHRLGHSKASVTLDIYGHALPENDKKASDTLTALLG